MKLEPLYTPVEPFTLALLAWRHRQEDQAHLTPQMARGYYRNNVSGLEQLAQLTGMPSRTLRRYVNGEARYIQLDYADRIAVELGIHLSELATDFRTLRSWLKEEAQQ